MKFLSLISKNSRAFLKSSTIYAIVNALTALFPLLFIPVLTRYIDLNEYGVYVIYVIIVKILGTLVSLGYTDSIAREYNRLNSDKFSVFLTSAFFISFIFALSLSIVTFWFSDWFSYYIELDRLFLSIMPLLAFCNFVTNSLLTIFQMKMEPWSFGRLKMCGVACEYCLALVLTIFYSMGLSGLIYSYLIGYALLGLISLYLLVSNGYIGLNVQLSSVKKSLPISLPLIPHELGGLLLSFSDRIMLNTLATPASVTVYTVGYQLGQVVSMIDTAVNKAWIPTLFKHLESKNRDFNYLKKTIFVYVAFLAIVSILVSVVGCFFIDILYTSEFIESKDVLILAAIAFFIFGLYKIAASFVFYSRNTKILGVITPLVVCCNILLNYLLIPSWGVTGAVASTIVSFSILAVTVSIFSKKIISEM